MHYLYKFRHLHMLASLAYFVFLLACVCACTCGRVYIMYAHICMYKILKQISYLRYLIIFFKNITKILNL